MTILSVRHGALSNTDGLRDHRINSPPNTVQLDQHPG